MQINSVKIKALLFFGLCVFSLLLSFVRIPIYNEEAKLSLCPSLVCIILIAYLIGPWFGFLSGVILAGVGILTGFTFPSIYGFIMVSISDGIFALFAGYCFRLIKKRNLSNTVNVTLTAVLSLIFSIALSTIASMIIMPIGMNLRVEEIASLFLKTFLPFFIFSKAINLVISAGIFGIVDINIKSANK